MKEANSRRAFTQTVWEETGLSAVGWLEPLPLLVLAVVAGPRSKWRLRCGDPKPFEVWSDSLRGPAQHHKRLPGLHCLEDGGGGEPSRQATPTAWPPIIDDDLSPAVRGRYRHGVATEEMQRLLNVSP